MHHPNQHSMFIVLFSVFVQLLVLCEADHNNGFIDCQQKQYYCGGQEYGIYYPFRLPDSPDYCGHPGFNLTCDSANTTLLATFDGKYYAVDDIDYGNQVIAVRDPSLKDVCTQNLVNYTFDLSLVNYTSEDVNITVFMNCSSTTRVLSPILHNISCLATEAGKTNSFFVLPRDDTSLLPADVWNKCSRVATIPIYEVEVGYLNSGMINIVPALQAGFSLQWVVGKWCKACTKSNGSCGFNRTSPDAKTCYCSDATSTGLGICTSPIPADSNAASIRNKKIIIAATGGFGGILFIILLSLCLRNTKFHKLIFWTKESNISQNVEAFLETYGTLAQKRHTYADVKKITHSFRNKLGQGGFGSVYKGNFSDGRLVAVKVLSNSGSSNGEDFVNEIASIGRSSHVNVVNLLGFCSEGSNRALIYEYMCNGSLDKLLSSEKPKTTPDWERLYRIAIGIARGLEYLHHGCNTKIVHFDIKPHNILLDEDFCPKISDFGLAKLCLQRDSILSMECMRGTVGYIAPEVFSRNFGVVSSKSDIYSYGMMVLEMAGGRKNMQFDVQNTSDDYFPQRIYKYLEENEDLVTYGVTSAETEGLARKMIIIGLWCIQTRPQNRPPIAKVLEMWEGSADDLQIPPKPNLSLPPTTLVSAICSSSICDDGGYSEDCNSAMLGQ